MGYFQVRCDYRVVNYYRRGFIILATRASKQSALYQRSVVMLCQNFSMTLGLAHFTTYLVTLGLEGGALCLVVMDDDTCSKGRGFKSCMGKTFFHFDFFVKIGLFV